MGHFYSEIPDEPQKTQVLVVLCALVVCVSTLWLCVGLGEFP